MFESDDCSDTPYIPDFTMHPQLVTSLDGHRFFVITDNTVTIDEWSYIYSDGCQQVEHSPPHSHEAREAVEILPSDIPFTIPVTFPFEYQYNN